SRVPHKMATPGVDRDQVSIESTHEERVAKDGEPSIDSATAGMRPMVRIGERPEDASGHRIEGNHVSRRLNRVHYTVHYQRGGFELLQGTGLINPLLLQVLHVFRSDLIEQTVTLAHGGSGVRQPVLRLLIGPEDPLE